MLQLKFPEAAAIALAEINTIGRHPECDVVLSLPTISRVHARIFERDGRFWIADTSKSGTFVNGLKVEDEAPLAEKDILHFNGSAKARIIDSDEAEAPTNPGVVVPEQIEEIERSLAVYGKRQEAIAAELNAKIVSISDRQDRNEQNDKRARCEHTKKMQALHEYLKKSGAEKLINQKGEVVLLWSAVLISLAVFGLSIVAVRERRVNPVESAFELIAANNEAAGAVIFFAVLAKVRGNQIKREEAERDQDGNLEMACENL
jgi:pSer/pThr/pTyr-binding forkhead associated (FHA) protein